MFYVLCENNHLYHSLHMLAAHRRIAILYTADLDYKNGRAPRTERNGASFFTQRTPSDSISLIRGPPFIIDGQVGDERCLQPRERERHH